jgi:hypothetical protein
MTYYERDAEESGNGTAFNATATGRVFSVHDYDYEDGSERIGSACNANAVPAHRRNSRAKTPYAGLNRVTKTRKIIAKTGRRSSALLSIF